MADLMGGGIMMRMRMVETEMMEMEKRRFLIHTCDNTTEQGATNN